MHTKFSSTSSSSPIFYHVHVHAISCDRILKLVLPINSTMYLICHRTGIAHHIYLEPCSNSDLLSIYTADHSELPFSSLFDQTRILIVISYLVNNSIADYLLLVSCRVATSSRCTK